MDTSQRFPLACSFTPNILLDFYTSSYTNLTTDSAAILSLLSIPFLESLMLGWSCCHDLFPCPFSFHIHLHLLSLKTQLRQYHFCLSKPQLVLFPDIHLHLTASIALATFTHRQKIHRSGNFVSELSPDPIVFSLSWHLCFDSTHCHQPLTWSVSDSSASIQQ